MNCELHELGEPLELELFQVRATLRCLLHTILLHRTLGVVQPVAVDSELFDLTYATCGDSAVDGVVEERISGLCTWLEKKTEVRECTVCLSFFEKRQRSAHWFSKGEERVYWEQWRVHLSIRRPEPSPALSLIPAGSQQPASRDPALQSAGGSAGGSVAGSAGGSAVGIPGGFVVGSGGSVTGFAGGSVLGPAAAGADAGSMERLQREVESRLMLALRLVNEKRDHIPPVVTSGTLSFPFEICVPEAEADSYYGLDMLKRLMVSSARGPANML